MTAPDDAATAGASTTSAATPTAATARATPSGADPDTDTSGATVRRWLARAAGVVAPVTLVTALLLYFGYVSARATYAYFGLDVDLIGFTTRDLVLRSPQPLTVPLVVLLLLAAGAYVAHVAWRSRLARAAAAEPDRARAAARWAVVAGLVVLAAGLVLLLGYPWFGGLAAYPLLTPVVVGAGAGLAAYAVATLGWLHPHDVGPDAHGPASRAPGPASGAPGTPRAPRGLAPRDAAAVVVPLTFVLVACLFWATATVADWSGRAVAHATARDLDALPAVVLDTKERLEPRDHRVTEERIPASAGQTYLYRYRGLRLLVQGDDRLFLVPDEWSPSGSTYVVGFDDSVRLRFRFVNDPP